MIGKGRQEQSSGADSNNYQAGRDVVVVQSGPSVSEVREIVHDAVRANLFEYKAEVERLIGERVAWFTEKLVDRMAAESPELLKATKDPDVQHAIIQAGVGFARTGDEELGDVLVDLLADRAEVETRSLLAVVLNDAVAVAPRLTEAEIIILTLHWKVSSLRSGKVVSLAGLQEFVLEEIVPLIPGIPKGRASYLHLQALGCAAVSLVGSTSFHTYWLSAYGGLFTKGFTREELSEELYEQLVRHSLLSHCLRDQTRLQFNSQNRELLKERLLELDLSHLEEEISALWTRKEMSQEEVLEVLVDIHPAMNDWAGLWQSTPLESLSLTAVGIALAHANSRRLTPAQPAPLSIWISEDD